MSSNQVLDIIASLNGGYNGDVQGKQIHVDLTGDATANYSLIHNLDENYQALLPEDCTVETYALTLVPIPSHLDEDGVTIILDPAS
jgi:hypothetical protein